MRFNILQKVRTGSAPLRRRFAYLASVNDIKKFPVADHRGIALIDDIIMKENTGMIQIYLTTSSQEYSYETIGDPDSKNFKVKFNGTHPGTEQEALEFSKNYLEEGFVVLIPSCDKGVKVLGSPDAPLVFTSSHKSEKAGEKFNFVFEQEIGSDTVYQLYIGLITLNNNIEVDMGDFLDQLKDYMKLDGSNLTEAQKANLRNILGSDGKNLGNADLSLSDNRNFNLKSYFLNFFNNLGLAKVGINKNNPTESLDVIGNIRSDSFILNDSPSDTKKGSVFRIGNDIFIKTDKGNEKLVKSGDYVLDDHGTISPDTLPPSTGWRKGWYTPKIASAFPGTNYPNCGNLKADSANFTRFYFNGSSWEPVDRLLMAQAKKIFDPTNNSESSTMMAAADRYDFLLDEKNRFTETAFNSTGQKLANNPIISKDLSTTVFSNYVPANTGNSIGTWVIQTPVVVTKLRVLVSNAGTGTFLARRSGAMITIVQNVPLVAGWNDVSVSFSALVGDVICYSTGTSSSALAYVEGGDGLYYSSNGTIAQVGNIGLEVWKSGEVIKVKSFAEVIVKKEEPLIYEARRIDKITNNAKLRQADPGVVSFFPDINKPDVFGNNTVSKMGLNWAGNFKTFDAKYIWSFAFSVKMPAAKYPTGKTICTINYGVFTVTLAAGSVGFAFAGNSIAYDYEGKTINVVITADAFFIRAIIDNREMGVHNVNRKMTSFNFTLNQDNGQVVKSAAFWNRKISLDRVAQWTANNNPYGMPSPEDKLFPQEGYPVGDNFLVNNAHGFDVMGEQNVIKFKDQYYLYFTVGISDPNIFIESGIGLAISSRVDGGYMMYTDDCVIGGKRNKAGVTVATSSWAGVKDGAVYIIAAADYTQLGAGGYIFKSMDGKNFTKVADFPPIVPTMANVGFWPEKHSDGYYYGIIEGRPAGNPMWEMWLVRSTSWETGWTNVQKLSSLQVAAGRTYGGLKIMRSSNNDRWMVVYHAATGVAGNLPSSIIYAECFDIGAPVNWVNKKLVLDVIDELESQNAYAVDQVATPHIIETEGKTYMSFVIAQNLPTLHCQIRFAQFDGNKEELFGLV
ncbi:hypothetical protein [Chryseobacterium vrystaatense]|uniref:BppU N-terminal domain-containing protein n=1 Tax=Chryseobacterium vrystaatense TaxID=307480 RepID=A0ABR4UP35_9FLAO|nr:hypothetical protein [Chryseobacterium vrystaatense]KFF26878.1 hypothetical protein IW16_06265 [Chryseobacterium vrystaatense]